MDKRRQLGKSREPCFVKVEPRKDGIEHLRLRSHEELLIREQRDEKRAWYVQEALVV